MPLSLRLLTLSRHPVLRAPSAPSTSSTIGRWLCPSPSLAQPVLHLSSPLLSSLLSSHLSPLLTFLLTFPLAAPHSSHLSPLLTFLVPFPFAGALRRRLRRGARGGGDAPRADDAPDAVRRRAPPHVPEDRRLGGADGPPVRRCVVHCPRRERSTAAHAHPPHAALARLRTGAHAHTHARAHEWLHTRAT